MKFCPNCESERDFRVENRTETYDVRGLSIKLPVQCEVCQVCGEDLFEEKRDNALLETAYAEYRRQKGLLFPHEIKAIRDRYSLGQKAFATLLGVSEATINRYEQGGLQDDAHDTMIRLASEPAAISSLLQQRGDRLGPQQRESAQAAIWNALVQPSWLSFRMPPQPSDVTGSRKFDFDRYADVVRWWCHKLGEVSEPKLNWLVFTSDVLSHLHLGQSLTGAAYVSRRFGPEPIDVGRLEERLDQLGLAERRMGREGGVYVWCTGDQVGAIPCGLSHDEENILSSFFALWANRQPRIEERLGTLFRTHFTAFKTPQLIPFSDAHRFAEAIEKQEV